MLGKNAQDNGLFKSSGSAMCHFCVKDFVDDEIGSPSKPTAKFTLRADPVHPRTRSKRGVNEPATQSLPRRSARGGTSVKSTTKSTTNPISKKARKAPSRVVVDQLKSPPELMLPIASDSTDNTKVSSIPLSKTTATT